MLKVFLKTDVNYGEFIPYELKGKIYYDKETQEVNPYYMLDGHRGEFTKRESELIFDESIALNTAIKSLERRTEQLRKLKVM
jgi:hypothetical protein